MTGNVRDNPRPAILMNQDRSNSELSASICSNQVNQFNRGLAKDDLARLVARYKQDLAGRPLPNGQLAPSLTLPANFSCGDNFFTQELRLSRTFPLGTERVRLVVFGEIFNLLNTANLVGYNGNLNEPDSFGQPAARFTQVFGSGGPRAFQFGARLSF